jgi:hypothetical protein
MPSIRIVEPLLAALFSLFISLPCERWHLSTHSGIHFTECSVLYFHSLINYRPFPSSCGVRYSVQTGVGFRCMTYLGVRGCVCVAYDDSSCSSSALHVSSCSSCSSCSCSSCSSSSSFSSPGPSCSVPSSLPSDHFPS